MKSRTNLERDGNLQRNKKMSPDEITTSHLVCSNLCFIQLYLFASLTECLQYHTVEYETPNESFAR